MENTTTLGGAGTAAQLDAYKSKKLEKATKKFKDAYLTWAKDLNEKMKGDEAEPSFVNIEAFPTHRIILERFKKAVDDKYPDQAVTLIGAKEVLFNLKLEDGTPVFFKTPINVASEEGAGADTGLVNEANRDLLRKAKEELEEIFTTFAEQVLKHLSASAPKFLSTWTLAMMMNAIAKGCDWGAERCKDFGRLLGFDIEDKPADTTSTTDDSGEGGTDGST